MKLLSVRLHPFAGVADRTIHFSQRLTVLCGPNEAGKSTVVKALHFALFVSTKQTPAKGALITGRFLPVGGGDSIKVTLIFEQNGEQYQLEKSWGAVAVSKLTLANRVTINDADEVQKRLITLLQLNQATYDNVLFTYQSDLGKTVERIKGSAEVTGSIKDMLRGSSLLNGGVSTEKLSSLVKSKLEEFYYNWDPSLNKPRDGKDIDRPHKRNVGNILKAYYTLRQGEELCKMAKRYDDGVDAINASMKTVADAYEECKRFVDANNDVVADVQERRVTDAEMTNARQHDQQLSSEFRLWPQVITTIEANEPALRNADDEWNKLQEENDIAQQREQGKQDVDLYNRVIQERKETEKLVEPIQGKIFPTASDINAYNTIISKLEGSRVKIEAQKLRLQLLSRENMEVVYHTVLGAENKMDLLAGDAQTIDVVGGFQLETPQLTITVQSGNADIPSLKQTMQELEQQAQEVLSKFGVSNLAEMQQLKLLADNIANKKDVEVALLRGKSFEQLEALSKKLEQLKPTRDTVTLSGLITTKQLEKNELSRKINEAKEHKERLESLYGTIDALTEKLLASKGVIKGLETKLKTLKPLPEGFETPESFIGTFHQHKQELSDLLQRKHTLEISRTSLDNDKPDYSAEEIAIQVEAAQLQLKKVQAEAAAYTSINNEVEQILSQSTQHAFRPLQQNISGYLSAITGQRYPSVTLEGTIPTQVGNDQKVLDLEKLSKGTMDALALATRLGMAQFYLKGSDGFLILDDPLVDMDINRQKAAAATIQQFAQDKQVIIFTCHSQHAGLLQEDSEVEVLPAL